MGPRYPANLAHLVDKPHCIYIIWCHDVPLYVGMSGNWQRRVPQHNWRFDRLGATHTDVWEACSSRWEAELLERDVIHALDPQHNVEHSPTVERMRLDWEWYSEWHEAYARGYDPAERWAREPAAMERALAILTEHGYAHGTGGFGPAATADYIAAQLGAPSERAS